MKKLHKDKIRSLNSILNGKIEDKTKSIIVYIESTMAISVKRVFLRYFESSDGEVYFAGIKQGILYSMKLQSGVNSP